MPVISLADKQMSELVTLHNDTVVAIGAGKQVVRFADRKAAEKRTLAMLNERANKEGTELFTLDNPGATGASEETVKEEQTGSEVTGQTTSTSNAGDGETTGETTMGSTAKKAKKAAKKNGAKKAKKSGAKKAATVKRRPEGALVGTGTNREKLMNAMKPKNKYVAISDLLMAVYGKKHKELKGPLMMVVKGVKMVLAANKTGTEIRKLRKDKENHFGIFDKSHPKA